MDANTPQSHCNLEILSKPFQKFFSAYVLFFLIQNGWIKANFETSQFRFSYRTKFESTQRNTSFYHRSATAQETKANILEERMHWRNKTYRRWRGWFNPKFAWSDLPSPASVMKADQLMWKVTLDKATSFRKTSLEEKKIIHFGYRGLEDYLAANLDHWIIACTLIIQILQWIYHCCFCILKTANLP